MTRTAYVCLGVLLGAAAGPTDAQQAVLRFQPYATAPGKDPETVAVAAAGDPGARRFDLSTSAPQRDGAPSRRTVRESGGPFVASGGVAFDALFAMAIDDARRDSVDRIADDAYNGGKPIDCRCFETGEKWHYVWTRDLSYALDLGLAGFDPARAVASLTFKTSALRPGVVAPDVLPAGSLQIVQDTGSGGSWPISTDRTAWALGAERTLANLTGPAREAFARTAYAALSGTVEADRAAAYDARDGLYGGEHSFLDWREQTYPVWIVDDLAAMAQMKALSTNILQYRALRLAARLADDRTVAQRYTGWAYALRTAIRAKFWDTRAGLFATYLTADADPARVAKYDLLGNDLAILSGIADAGQARTILSRYPFAPFGPPVVWPQAPDTFVYHNRAQWPFVTAYTLRAAAASTHVAAADRAIDALVRGAALHLSNMENLEWLTGRSRFDDGPEINSARQLWSVGGYIGAVTGTIFGWNAEPSGVRVAPFLTAHMRSLFGTGDTATLSGVRFAGKKVDIVLHLPPPARDGSSYPVKTVRLNDAPAPARIVAADLRDGGNVVEVSFGSPRRSATRVTEVPQVSPLSHDDARAFMAATPAIALERRVEGITVRILNPAASRYTILRDGAAVAKDVAGPIWTDRSRARAVATACYSAIATTGLASQPSAAACDRGAAAQTISIDDPRVRSDAPMLPASGDVAARTLALGIGKTATFADIRVDRAGTYAIALRYDNHVFALNTGVTNAVKRLTVTGPDGREQTVIVQMPHIRPIGDTHPLRLSTRAYMRLAPGVYRMTLSDFFNMSALQSNASYGSPGGASGPVNEARIAELLIDAVD